MTRTLIPGRLAPGVRHSPVRRSSRGLTIAAALSLVAATGCASAGAGRSAAPQAPPAAAGSAAASVRDTDVKTLENLFVGRFAGVTMQRARGGGLQLRIRGGSNSFYASNEPLYVVDGTPLPQGTGGIVHLNPHDIEGIEVLKNPADVAIYGVRGGNGVIKITTRRPGKR